MAIMTADIAKKTSFKYSATRPKNELTDVLIDIEMAVKNGLYMCIFFQIFSERTKEILSSKGYRVNEKECNCTTVSWD